MPSLKPKRLRGVACDRGGRGGPAEPELAEADGGDAVREPREVADGVHGDLRVVGAGLDAQVAVAAGGVERVVGERGQRLERGRPAGGEAEAILAVAVNSVGPKPAVTVSRDGVQAERLAGVLRRAVLVARAAAAADLRARPPSRRRPRVQVRSRSAQVGARRARRAGRSREVQAVLDRRGDAGLVAAVRTAPTGSAGAVARRSPPEPCAAATPPRADARRRRPRAAAAGGGRRAAAPPVTAARPPSRARAARRRRRPARRARGPRPGRARCRA